MEAGGQTQGMQRQPHRLLRPHGCTADATPTADDSRARHQQRRPRLGLVSAISDKFIFEYSNFCRSEINRHISADIGDASERDDLVTEWRKKYKPKAEELVDNLRDWTVIKRDWAGMRAYKDLVELKIREALVLTINDFDPEVGNHFRKAVDELTTKLRINCSQLGYLLHNPQDKPYAAGQKPMKAPASKTAKVNVPARLLRGLEALKSKEKSFLEDFIDQEGSFKAAIEVLKNKDQVVEDPRSANKIAQLQGELDKSLQLSNAKNVRIQELETNGCALISLMLSNRIEVLRRYKQCFEYSDESTQMPPGSFAGSSSGHGQADPDALYAHPLNRDVMVTQNKLRWPLHFLPGGSMYGQTPRPDEMLPADLVTSATSDMRALAGMF